MRLRIPNVDRVGLVLDISRILAARQINIISMEVELKTIYLEIEDVDETTQAEIISDFQHIAGVLGVLEINLMPHQEKSEQLNAVLTSAGEGILAIDRHCRITQCNPAAETILGLTAGEAFGKPVQDILPKADALLEILRYGTAYDNKETLIERNNSHCLSSGRPIKDQSGMIIGAVAILKDIRDVRKLIHKVTGQLTFTFEEIIYASKTMQRVVGMAKVYARGDSTVLIRGETGTGKELFARALHAASPRKNNIFITLNCAAIPDTLLESELFGYEEGAFTGAAKGGKQGLFELANGGTMFLDEIGEISAHLQAKLLRVLQDKKVRRIGGSREITIDVRILAATNRNLEDMIAKDLFREDLYYRLNVIPLFVPPLRERSEDIPVLARFFLARFSNKLSKTVDTISEKALRKLCFHNWPGNIRELENAIERAVNIVEGNSILSEHIVLQYDNVGRSYDHLEERTLAQMMDEAEFEILQAALRKYHSSRQLGTALGVSHTAILRKLHKHGLDGKQRS